MNDLMTEAVAALVAAIRAEVRADAVRNAVPPRLLRVEEAARALGIARSNAYRLINDGSLKSVLVGHRRLISASALEDFIDRAEDAAAAEARARR